MSDTFNITGNETIDELEAMLDNLDGDSVEGEELEGNGEGGEGKEGIADDGNTELNQDKTDLPKVDSHADSAPAMGKEQSADDGEPTSVIMAKDNVHTIPYEVLENERRENERLKQELSEMGGQLTKAEQNERLLEIRNTQLKELGVEPADLPENFKLSKEALTDLKEDYPELASAIVALDAKMERLAANVPEPQSTKQSTSNAGQNEVLAALQGNIELSSWQAASPEKWAAALDIDDALRADPNWQNKTCAERFEEVVRQTNQKFGADTASINAQAKAKAALQKAEGDLPASPSEMGTSDNSHDGSLLERAASMSTGELASMMGSMTPDQIEALLEQSDEF